MRACSLLIFALLLVAGCSGNLGASAVQPFSSKGKGGPGTAAGTSSADQSQQSSSSGKSVTVPPSQQRLAGITTAVIQPRSVPRTLTVPGQIMMDEERTAHVGPYTDGQVVRIVKQPGDTVRPHEVLAYLHSHSVHETVGALAQDFANIDRQKAVVTYAQQKRDRYNHLYSIQAASLEQQQMSNQDLIQAQTDLANYEAMARMEKDHLGDLLQIPPDSITPANLYDHEYVPVVSPIGGTVIARAVTPGMVLEPGMEAYTVSSLDEVWMVAAVNESELPHVRTGEHVVIRSDAWPNRTFDGTVTLVGSTLDPTTRTLQVRATLKNPGQALKPQMFVTATIDESGKSGASDLRQSLVIPEQALQEVNGVDVVFVTKDDTHFTPRAVQTRPPVDHELEVTDGLNPGERIAVTGAFMLKSDLLKGTIGEE